VDVYGDVYVTGKSQDDSGYFMQYATIKYNSSGQILWNKRYQGPGAGNSIAKDLTIDGWGNVYVTGTSYDDATGFDFATIKYTELFCGDANGDEIVDIGDVVYLVAYLYRNGPPPDLPASGDVNRDGIVDVGDIVYLIGYLYRGGSPPCAG
jgi:hypothetical protein